jgi:ATP-binding cassette, subfamily F, member 3
MLRLEDISINFAGRLLLTDQSWAVRDRDRVGLVGANGSGKSTLLRVAVGLQESDGGTIRVTRGQTVGYLPQEGATLPDEILRVAVRNARDDMVALERRIDGHLARLERSEADDAEHTRLLDRLQRDQEAFRVGGGYELEAEAGRVLNGLGFPRDRWDARCGDFSRGWQMRIALARLLMLRPDFMLLDEPTNHLDMESRAWLERYLDDYAGAVVVVSHDRHFLDRVVERTTEVEAGELHEYRGNYTVYTAMRAERRQRLSTAQAKETREIERIRQFVAKFRYDKKRASQVQSRIRSLEKRERIEIPGSTQRVRFHFPPAPRCGSPVLRAESLTKSYGKLTVLDDAEMEISRGERVAVVGPNGAGKSTLLRLLAGRERPDGGFAEFGHNVLPAYFAQDQLDEMDGERAVIAELEGAARHLTEQRLRGVLGAFLFAGDDVHKRVAILSGGERNRLALAKILLRGANLLLLDEPTNHLDMLAKEVLLDALRDFTGTVVFVSHDRHFVSALADKVIEVGGGEATTYLEGFEDFLWRKARGMGFEGERIPGLPAPDLWLLTGRHEVASHERKGTAGTAYRERIRRQRAAEKHAREIEQTMARIEELEVGISDLHARMARPEMAVDFAGLASLQAEVDPRRAEVDKLYARWEELQSLIR